MPIIKYENVDIHIDSKIILEDVNFTLKAGDFAYITGTVGSGKSTLLKSIYGEVDIHCGKAILFDEFSLKGLRRSKLPALRKRMGIVFQDFQLLTDRTVHDNLEFVLKCTGWSNKNEREKRIQEVLDLVDLPKKGYKMPHELSGGEQQRIVIARAILNHPTLLLADEPTGNLDNETGTFIMQLLHNICKEEKTAVLMITHNEQWLTTFPGIEFLCKDKKLIENKKADSETVEEVVEEAQAEETPAEETQSEEQEEAVASESTADDNIE